MNETKPWYQSRSVIAGVVTVLAGVAGVVFNVSVDDATQTEITNLVVSATTAIGGLVAIIYRVRADKKIQ